MIIPNCSLIGITVKEIFLRVQIFKRVKLQTTYTTEGLIMINPKKNWCTKINILSLFSAIQKGFSFFHKGRELYVISQMYLLFSRFNLIIHNMLKNVCDTYDLVGN